MSDEATTETPRPVPAPRTPTALLYAALAKAQGEFPVIERTREVEVKSDRATYTFKYAPLDSIFLAVRPALVKYALAIYHRVDTTHPKEITVTTVLAHESGEEEIVPLTFPYDYMKVQAFGSLVTYLKRYGVEAILGICAEQDDDGNAADGNGRQMADRSQAPAPKGNGAKSAVKPATNGNGAASPSDPMLGRVSASEVQKIRQAVNDMIPEDLSDEERILRAYGYIAWAVGRKVETIGELNKAEGTIVLKKCQDGEVPPSVSK